MKRKRLMRFITTISITAYFTFECSFNGAGQTFEYFRNSSCSKWELHNILNLEFDISNVEQSLCYKVFMCYVISYSEYCCSDDVCNWRLMVLKFVSGFLNVFDWLWSFHMQLSYYLNMSILFATMHVCACAFVLVAVFIARHANLMWDIFRAHFPG